MSVEKSVFGKSSKGQEVYLYTITNAKGVKAVVTDFGAILVKLLVPDAKGEVRDVVLGFDTVEEYEKNPCFFGALIGPSANRIAGASFSIDGTEYQVDVNDNGNNLHSHIDEGYHKRIWDTVTDESTVTFSLEDDATMGFPGKKQFRVTYSLNDDNELKIHYHASADKRTIINPTNHTYFNLDGAGSGTIENHELKLEAANYTPVAEGSIPTGEIAAVKGTPMDFTDFRKIGLEINADFEQLKLTGGYDHNWIIDGYDQSLKHFGTVKGAESGIVMECCTTLPGVQFYAGNYITRQNGKDGKVYDYRHGLCLETQFYPDTIHHKNFPSCVFGGEGNDYDSETVYQFHI